MIIKDRLVEILYHFVPFGTMSPYQFLTIVTLIDFFFYFRIAQQLPTTRFLKKSRLISNFYTKNEAHTNFKNPAFTGGLIKIWHHLVIFHTLHT